MSRNKANPYGLLNLIPGNCLVALDQNIETKQCLFCRKLQDQNIETVFIPTLIDAFWVSNILINAMSVDIYDSFIYSENQDLAGDVVQNLHDFFRTMYKKVFV